SGDRARARSPWEPTPAVTKPGRGPSPPGPWWAQKGARASGRTVRRKGRAEAAAPSDSAPGRYATTWSPAAWSGRPRPPEPSRGHQAGTARDEPRRGLAGRPCTHAPPPPVTSGRAIGTSGAGTRSGEKPSPADRSVRRCDWARRLARHGVGA